MTHDLRLDDNSALCLAAESTALALVYVINPAWFAEDQYGLIPMGEHRWRFIQQSLADLSVSLESRGHRLNILRGDPPTIVSELIQQFQFQQVIISRQFGFNEKAQLTALTELFPDVAFSTVDTYTLFNFNALPMPVSAIPETYSRFRRKAEKVSVDSPCCAPARLPDAIEFGREYSSLNEALNSGGHQRLIGGETAAKTHAESYFSGELPLSYKLVRNELDGWENSSKFSAWLNSGCFSARRLVDLLSEFEHRRERNDSTYWLFVELLWREYFQWLALKIGKKLFLQNGNAGHRISGRFDVSSFSEWCHGETRYPLVNACMKQLSATGYLSNRGRQIAASCLINEMAGDWRYGAAWFASQLIDYDVAANWGNWQYLAGVGADPKGGRHFNLAKQTEIYDADGSFQSRWLT